MNNIWYHGTPDVRELQEEGGFTQRHIDIDYVDDIGGWRSTQDAMRVARESGNDEDDAGPNMDVQHLFRGAEEQVLPVCPVEG